MSDPRASAAGAPTVLYVSHNHPDVRPGGAEAYALDLHRVMRERGVFRPVLVAKGGPPVGKTASPHHGTFFSLVGGEPDEYFLYTDGYEFDWFLGTLTDKSFYTNRFVPFLKALSPDVVHFQHTLFLGYELLEAVRRALPDVPIVYTLHEFLPICHNDGQMMRTAAAGSTLCERASPRRCSECFPSRSQQDFFLRERFIKSMFDHVDVFLTPSRFLAERYVRWGVPEDKVVVEEVVRRPPARLAGTDLRARRDRFAYFGQLTPFKGVDVLLEAMLRVKKMFRTTRGGEHPILRIHGANLELQTGPFQEKLVRLLDELGEWVELAGAYAYEDLPRLMEAIDWVVVPSVWWENSPLVIQEAFTHRRPVLCSDIGGMAEKVTDGVNGLHFPVGNVNALARLVGDLSTETTTWGRLQAGISTDYDIERHHETLCRMYADLMNARKVVA